MTEVDLIVPTVPGREESLERCIESYERLTDADLNVIVVKDSPSSGGGWLIGLGESKAPYVHLSCDDLECKNPRWLEVCVEAVEKGKLPCPVVYRPDGGIESCGGEMTAPGNLISYLQDDWTPADFTTVPFVSREQVGAIGLLPIHYSSDVWVSYRGRQLGYETVVRRGYDLIHYQHQVRRGAGMSQGQRANQDRQLMYEALNG